MKSLRTIEEMSAAVNEQAKQAEEEVHRTSELIREKVADREVQLVSEIEAARHVIRRKG